VKQPKSLTLAYARYEDGSIPTFFEFGYIQRTEQGTIHGSQAFNERGGQLTLVLSAPNGQTEKLRVPKGGRLEVWDAS
jgi:hypothetical protein